MTLKHCCSVSVRRKADCKARLAKEFGRSWLLSAAAIMTRKCLRARGAHEAACSTGDDGGARSNCPRSAKAASAACSADSSCGLIIENELAPPWMPGN